MDSNTLISQKAKVVLPIAFSKRNSVNKNFEKISNIFAPGKFKLEGNLVNITGRILSISIEEPHCLLSIEDDTGQCLISVNKSLISILKIGKIYSFIQLRCFSIDNLILLKTISDTVIVRHE